MKVYEQFINTKKYNSLEKLYRLVENHKNNENIDLTDYSNEEVEIIMHLLKYKQYNLVMNNELLNRARNRKLKRKIEQMQGYEPHSLLGQQDHEKDLELWGALVALSCQGVIGVTALMGVAMFNLLKLLFEEREVYKNDLKKEYKNDRNIIK